MQSAVARIERQIAAALRRTGYSGNSSLLVVAASGGPDSSALLYSLDHLKDAHGLRLHVAHLNHDFRGKEADEDAEFVVSLAEDLGLPFTVEQQDPTEYRRQRRISSFEQLAREMRYMFLAQVAKNTGAKAVAVGHTVDDQAETVLQHVLRGAGLHGLRGMSEVSSWPWPTEGPDLQLFRPLLSVTKADTVAYCRELGRDYRDDSGNYLSRFTRNRVRHDLLPALASGFNPRVSESLARLARTASVDLDFIEGEAAKLWPHVALATADEVRFDLSGLSGVHPALQRILLRRGYAALTGGAMRLRESHLTAVADMVAYKTPGTVLELPAGIRLHRGYTSLVLSKDPVLPCPLPLLEDEHPLTLPSKGESESTFEGTGWRITLSAGDSAAPSVAPASDAPNPAVAPVWSARLDRATLTGPLSLRTRRPGDRFQPLGMQGEKKLQDFFTDSKVPRSWRDRVPLLVSERGIAWVVGYRVAHWAAATGGALPDADVILATFETNMRNPGPNGLIPAS